jgi:glycerol-3-phosphate acyltransferase PlsY
MLPAAGLVIAYIAGSFPSAYLAGRLLKGVDLRKQGSGNLGATNVYRNLGAGPALVVLLIDAAKGALPVYVLPRLFNVPSVDADTGVWWALGYGAAAILGHAKPVFLLWKGGGKGVATAAGVFAVLAPFAVLWTTVICAAVVAYTGYMSMGSIAAALTFPAFVWITVGTSSPLFATSFVVCLFIVWTHRSNLGRLRAGTEQRLFRKIEDRP